MLKTRLTVCEIKTGVEIMFKFKNFCLVKQKCLVKLIKQKKHLDVEKGCLLRGFPKCFKNAKIAVLEFLELKMFFTAQPWW